MIPPWFSAALVRYRRIAIAGGPRTGKTTIANVVTDRPVLHTDDFMAAGWEDQPWMLIQRTKDLRAFVAEGVQVPRGLRKGLSVDVVVWLGSPLVPLTDGQRTMSKAVGTVFEEWRHLNAGRVPIVTGRLSRVHG